MVFALKDIFRQKEQKELTLYLLMNFRNIRAMLYALASLVETDGNIIRDFCCKDKENSNIKYFLLLNFVCGEK